jgi:hypothetical protein
MKALRKRYGRAAGQAAGRTENSRYEIVGLVPKPGGGFLKKRYVVAYVRDAQEALAELFRLRETQRASGAYGHGRWTYVVFGLDSAKGKLKSIVTDGELQARAARGQ